MLLSGSAHLSQNMSHIRPTSNAVLLVTGTHRREHITSVLFAPHRLPIRQRIQFKLLLLVYRCTHQLAPAYLTDLVLPYVPARSLRSAEQNLLVVKRYNLERYRPLSRRLDRCDRMIQNESRDPFGGNVHYVTMQITFLTRKFRNGERNLYCDVVHITTKWVSSLTLDCNGVFAIKAYGRRSFSLAGPSLWNALHSAIRNSMSLPAFRSSLKTHLFREAFATLL